MTPQEQPMTQQEQKRFIRVFMVPVVVFSIIASYFGIIGYCTPLPSFQSYLAQLPPGYSSVLNNGTYIFYFQTQYAIQAVLTAALAIIGTWAFIYPHRAMTKFESMMERIGLGYSP